MPRSAPVSPNPDSLTTTTPPPAASLRPSASPTPPLSPADAFPLSRALSSLWTLNATAHPPATPTKGCPVLPRFVPLSGYDGLVADPCAAAENSGPFHARAPRNQQPPISPALGLSMPGVDREGPADAPTECPFKHDK